MSAAKFAMREGSTRETVREDAQFQSGGRLARHSAEDDATMPEPRKIAMSGRVGKLESTVTEFRGRFNDIDTRFNEIDARFDAIDSQFDAIDRRFETIDRRFDRIDQRFMELEERLSTKIAVRGEHLEALIRTLADNVIGTFEAINRKIDSHTDEVREETRMLRQILANHEQPIVTLEQDRRA